MAATFFRERLSGPEALIEDVVADCLPRLFPSSGYPCWTAGSLTVGAGRPDLTFVMCEPRVRALANLDMQDVELLAFLRAVRSARLETLADKTGLSEEVLIQNLDGLVEASAVLDRAKTYALAPQWREILPEVVTIEVKVANWRRAADQANRNRIFAHRSYVALPERVACRVRREEAFQSNAIGILGVGEQGDVRVVKRARRGRPRVWQYYYRLALFAAKHV